MAGNKVGPYFFHQFDTAQSVRIQIGFAKHCLPRRSLFSALLKTSESRIVLPILSKLFSQGTQTDCYTY